ncbi:MAG TPA: alpha/beta hydrolase [Caulobacteraceae bacterium]|jgi:pimeloyl-ACP methyl ester carboxylesterase|nr:alpha/beta hydrolase [Caulobacteraceae bacterium]
MLATWLEIILGALVVLGLAALGFRAWRQARVAAALAIGSPNGIAEEGFVRIGGVEQWVSIRGEDLANPVLVVAHGGPGSSLTPFIPIVSRAWERHFTVVHWDQRGAGRTFSRAKTGQGEVSLDRIAEDGLEVVAYALKRTGHAKAIVLGTSWGSLVAVTMARRRPELFHVLVGAGQVVDSTRNEEVGYAALLARVRAAGDARSEAELVKLGAPPWTSMRQLMTERRILIGRYSPPSERGMQTKVLMGLLSAPGLSLREAIDWFGGASFSSTALRDSIVGYSDGPPYAPFAMPFVVIQGSEDIQTPTSLAAEYLDAVEAPAKRFVSLPGGGHMASIAMPDAFLQALLAEARPFALAA